MRSSTPPSTLESGSPPHVALDDAKFAVWRTFNNPAGRYAHWARRVDEVAGSVGWTAKGVVYALLGGIICLSSLGVAQSHAQESPLGAFFLLSSTSVGPALLCVLLCFVGAGYDVENGARKSFVKYRLSPFVSGGVYIVYASYVAKKMLSSAPPQTNTSTAPATCTSLECWQTTPAGRFGLAVLGIAFLCAFISQLVPALGGAFKGELDPRVVGAWGMAAGGWFRGVLRHTGWGGRGSGNRGVDIGEKVEKAVLYGFGHVSFAARALGFLFCAVLFFRAVSEGYNGTSGLNNCNYIASALEQLNYATWGKVV
ncbi:hypothetical protein M427DRAFT_38048 [Gonapodya prolifera JEL478]|uniref:DUF1206 domain-containing protein n=1 Tax=Gonapodya prolifera (strain JEL478) TaxID=1344416 RepID=A0A139A0R1_GONPJ|nr:hypothetical protein M427DRAFT_38048 [Gonapodya prolifera JEL478]|eukprot:KXS09943.1 hypothetical protein M427DRAFT_38048 [Gonapodya prolifera JEL478]